MEGEVAAINRAIDKVIANRLDQISSVLLGQISSVLREVLGGTYGGPSIGYEYDKYVLYSWYDAPVGSEILVEDPTWEGFIAKLRIVADEKIATREKEAKKKVFKKVKTARKRVVKRKSKRRSK